jgi:hypothetical protein
MRTASPSKPNATRVESNEVPVVAKKLAYQGPTPACKCDTGASGATCNDMQVRADSKHECMC